MIRVLMLSSAAAWLVACSAPMLDDSEIELGSPATVEPTRISRPSPLIDGLAAYAGVWESGEGAMRQAFVFEEGAVSVEACLQVPGEAGAWRTVSSGRYEAVGEEIHGQFTGEGMGFERLDVIGYPVGGGGGVDWVNTAQTDQGEQTSYETWAAPINGAFTYVVERVVEGRREFWFSGEWRFRNDLVAECGGSAG